MLHGGNTLGSGISGRRWWRRGQTHGGHRFRLGRRLQRLGVRLATGHFRAHHIDFTGGHILYARGHGAFTGNVALRRQN